MIAQNDDSDVRVIVLKQYYLYYSIISYHLSVDTGQSTTDRLNCGIPGTRLNRPKYIKTFKLQTYTVTVY